MYSIQPWASQCVQYSACLEHHSICSIQPDLNITVSSIHLASNLTQRLQFSAFLNITVSVTKTLLFSLLYQVILQVWQSSPLLPCSTWVWDYHCPVWLQCEAITALFDFNVRPLLPCLTWVWDHYYPIWLECETITALFDFSVRPLLLCLTGVWDHYCPVWLECETTGCRVLLWGCRCVQYQLVSLFFRWKTVTGQCSAGNVLGVYQYHMAWVSVCMCVCVWVLCLSVCVTVCTRLHVFCCCC